MKNYEAEALKVLRFQWVVMQEVFGDYHALAGFVFHSDAEAFLGTQQERFPHIEFTMEGRK